MNPTSINNGSIESSVEISIRSIIKSWHRRQKWQQLFSFNPKQHQELITDKAQWRITLTSFLQSNPVHVFTIFLLLLDLIFTTLELSSSLLSCTSAERNDLGKAWLHWGGISLLSLLAVKSVALAIGLGRLFFNQPGYILDGVAVIGALILEAVLERKGGGLILVVSLWRVLRVVESAFELSDEAIEEQIEGVICQFEVLKDENRRLVETVAEKNAVIEKLYEELSQYRQADHNSIGITE